MAFVADVHLRTEDISGLKKVLGFLEKIQQLEVKHLFILGDFFHLWVNSPFLIRKAYRPVIEKFSQLYRSGIKITYLVGNRDFLIRDYYQTRPEIEVFSQALLCNLGDRRLYLSHGDELCLNDRHYQFYKIVIRHRVTRILTAFLPGAIKEMIASYLSQASRTLVSRKSKTTLGVTIPALERIFRQGIDIIIHGHTHRSYLRQMVIEGKNREVYGLEDWSRTASFLFYDAPTGGFTLKQV